eukprot:g6817.t1
MGGCVSAPKQNETKQVEKYSRIGNNFKTLPEVQQALAQAGLEACQLIVGVDFTKSNLWTGKNTFNGRSLHAIDGGSNPYQTAVTLIARTLESFDDDNLIPCYGFGDVTTQDRAVFSFLINNEPSHGLQSIIQRYQQLAEVVTLSGPTSFAPLIKQAIRDVYNSGMRYHILLIIADGQVAGTCAQETSQAIVDACKFPLSIVMVGVGDGPWDMMEHFDDDLPRRPWDNFHFVQLEKIIRNPNLETPEMCEAAFALEALMEIPFQYKMVINLRGEGAKHRVINDVQSIPASILIQPPDVKYSMTHV